MKKNVKVYKQKTVKLKNRYTGDIVYCDEYDSVTLSDGINFLAVYTKENPDRVFLANKDAYIVL